MSVEDYLALPYVLDVTAVRLADGDWVCHLEYPEFPGCVAEGATPFEALARLDERCRGAITQLLERGLQIPLPRRRLTGSR